MGVNIFVLGESVFLLPLCKIFSKLLKINTNHHVAKSFDEKEKAGEKKSVYYGDWNGTKSKTILEKLKIKKK